MMGAKHAGFTLLELMIAMAIFALAGVAVMSSSSAHMRAMASIEEQQLAAYVAENELQIALQATQWPPKAEQSGQTTLAQRQWTWKIRTKDTEDDNFKMLTIEVSPQQQPERILTTLSTFVGNPNA
jgi:general secretion pathway protein I